MDFSSTWCEEHLSPWGSQWRNSKQPPGFEHPPFPHQVCKLQRAIYSLKQAPRAWFQQFTSFLSKRGLIGSANDPSMFVSYRTDDVLILPLYDDDIITIDSSTSLLMSFISTLQSEFAEKDLGSLHYFLRVKVSGFNNSLLLYLIQNSIGLCGGFY